MIEALNGFRSGVLAFAGKGHVTKADYETTVEQALQHPGKIRLYYQVGPDFAGIGAGAVWGDFKVGIEHLLRWERVAVVTDVDWIRYTLRAFSFLIPGVAKIFSLNEQAQARQWVLEGVKNATSLN
jgi:hypothetical protein